MAFFRRHAANAARQPSRSAEVAFGSGTVLLGWPVIFPPAVVPNEKVTAVIVVPLVIPVRPVRWKVALPCRKGSWEPLSIDPTAWG